MQPGSLFPQPEDHRLEEIDILLRAYYGDPAPRQPWDPLTQFIYSILSARTRTEMSLATHLRQRFGTWENLRDAPLSEIEQAVHQVTFPDQKALHLKQALVGITARVGTLTLDFLAKYRTEKIRSWLEQFPGVGPKISAQVVNNSTLQRLAVVVDSHHLRVAHRLGLTPRLDAEHTETRLMRLVPAIWTPQQLDQHHVLVELHGQQLCTFNEPQCPRCPLLGRCPTGARLTGNPQPTGHSNSASK